MPNIFLSGIAEFEAIGTEDQVNDVMSDVVSGWSNINVTYEEDEISKVIEFRLSNKLTGSFEFTRESATKIKVSLNGVLKTSAQTSAITALITNSTPWTIDSISGGYRSIDVTPLPDTSKLQLLKKAPKA